MREESTDTRECESCQLKDMDVHMDENKEELSFVPSAVSDSAEWHEPKFMSDRQCRKDDLLVEHDSEPVSINLCQYCDNLRQRREDGAERT